MEKEIPSPGATAPTEAKECAVVTSQLREQGGPVVLRKGARALPLELGARRGQSRTPINRGGKTAKGPEVSLGNLQSTGSARAAGTEALEGSSADAPSNVAQDLPPTADEGSTSPGPRRSEGTSPSLQAQSSLFALRRGKGRVEQIFESAEKTIV